jgi:hypothetical protein
VQKKVKNVAKNIYLALKKHIISILIQHKLRHFYFL